MEHTLPTDTPVTPAPVTSAPALSRYARAAQLFEQTDADFRVHAMVAAEMAQGPSPSALTGTVDPAAAPIGDSWPGPSAASPSGELFDLCMEQHVRSLLTQGSYSAMAQAIDQSRQHQARFAALTAQSANNASPAPGGTGGNDKNPYKGQSQTQAVDIEDVQAKPTPRP